MHYFQDKAVYITGGSSGIGLAAAKQLASYGAHVAIAARGQERLQTALTLVKAAAKSPGQRFAAISVDVANPADCARALKETVDGLGHCDVVIANAGMSHPARVLETPDDVWEKLMRVNYFGTVHTVKAFLPHLMERRGGAIGIVSSLLGFMGIYGYAGYAASKFAQVGFAECLRQEVLDRNIRVTVLYPPDTDTPMFAEENKIKPPETVAVSGTVKVMSPDDVADELLRGIAAGKLHVVPGAMGKLTRLAKRVAPGLVDWVADGSLKKHQGK